MSPRGRRGSVVSLQDESRLAELGYKQELKRDWSVLHNFGVSFSIISIVSGITTLFSYGLNTGGPGVISCGWIIVSFFTFFVGLSMAEIVSAIPTSGGPYFWAAMLAPKKYGPFFSWVTGWFNFVGQFAVTTGITFGLAGLVSTLAAVKTSYTPTAAKTLGIYAALLASHGIVNTFGVYVLRYLNDLSILLHSAGVFSIAVAVVAAAPNHRSAREVFAFFNDNTGDPGWSVRASPAYVAICGILLSQYTITGFDASAHMSEETHNAARSAPIGVLTSIGVSAVFGFFYIVCLLFSIQDFDRTIGATQPVLQIFIDVFGDDGAIALMTLIIWTVWHCGLFSITSNSRMMFAFSRDRALPGWFDYTDKRFKSPTRTIWLAATLAFILALPSLGSSVAFAAATSIATIGLYISYTIPVLISIVWHDEFEKVKGPFNLGRFSRPVGLIACLWVAFITIVFCLPTANPVTSQTLNYTPVAVGIVLFFVMGSWFLWARKWFVGPIRQVEASTHTEISEQDVLEETEGVGKGLGV